VRAFREAVEANDHDALHSLLAENVVFTSPVAFKPYPGRAVTAALLLGVPRVFTYLSDVREINSADGRDHALVFEAEVGDKQINGCDFLHLNEEGKIDDFVVMVRPLSAANALSQAMAAQFDRILKEAGEEEAAAQASS
jgi:hypothetical protein